jgi:hypothetical protein
MDPFDVAIMFFFAAVDAAAYAADRLISWIWPHGARVRRLRLTDWYRGRHARRRSRTNRS